MTYLFLCDECGEKHERTQCPVGTEESLCPDCGECARRVFAPGTIVMPSNCWANATRKDFLEDPERQPEFKNRKYSMQYGKVGTWQ